MSVKIKCRKSQLLVAFAALESQRFTWHKTSLSQFMVCLIECLQLLVPGENPYRVDTQQINQRASLLQRYLSDEQKELQALYMTN